MIVSPFHITFIVFRQWIGFVTPRPKYFFYYFFETLLRSNENRLKIKGLANMYPSASIVPTTSSHLARTKATVFNGNIS